MKLTEHEMRGVITGKALPADIRVGESVPAYLVRKFDELQEQVKALSSENANMRSAIDQTIGWQESVDTENVESVRLLVALKTPVTDDIRNELRAEGIYFAANRMLAAWDSGFIDDTPAQAYDISGAVLSAVEFLPNASPEEFKRDFADEIRREIKTVAPDAEEGV